MPLNLGSKRRFAILARVSTHGQLAGHSLPLQEKLGREYVKRCGGVVVKVYTGQESATTDERRTLEIALSEAGKVYTDLVIQDTTRLSRNPGIMFQAMTRLAQANVCLHDFSGPLPFETPEGEFRLLIDSVVGRYTSRQGVHKSIQARVDVLEKGGIAAGRPPWGRAWDKARQKFEVIPDSRKKLKLVYELIVNRKYSLNRAAKDKDVMLANSSLRKAILQAGRSHVTQSLLGHVYQIPCPALLTQSQQRRMQQRVAENAVVRPRIKGRYVLQGLVRCSCGAAMTGQSSIKDGSVYSVYRHSPATYSESKGCCWGVPADLLDTDVFEACVTVIKDGTSFRKAIEAALSNEESGRLQLERLQRRLRREIAQLREELDRLVDVLSKLKGGESEGRTRIRIKECEQKLNDKRSEQIAGARKLEMLKLPSASADEIAFKMRSMCGRGWPRKAPSTEQKREFVRTMVGRLSKESPAGIFVRMFRKKGGSKKDVFWRYELNGSLILATNYIDRSFEEHPADVLKIQIPPIETVKRIAAIIQGGAVDRVKLGIQYRFPACM